ncbi:sensor histidine kinase [Sporolactobacillus kofuensis]|uniref:Sensor histidine kinase n=1 Tax=Sporolactobacillus kofuensis TaxID=269672 RepID=A0ABW1WJB8_9BACL|nr:ATP-binding protein [Sporolactobacillus kofuensis]MCO7176903.1 histidine kinase [Sporolactobacillus kofuensis]
MDKGKRKKWMRSLVLLIALSYSLVLAIHFMIAILGSPYVGIYTVNQHNKVKVSFVAPYSWAESAGVKVGDVVVGVNGQRPEEDRNITHFDMVGQAKSVDLERGLLEFHLDIDNSASKPALLFYLIIPLAFFTTCFVAVLFLYVRKESKPVVRTLIALLITFSPVLFEMAANARHDSWSLRLTSVAIVFTMIFLTQFLRDYFLDSGFLLVSNWLLGCLYLCGSLIVINSCFLINREVSAYYLQELFFSVFVFGLLCIQLTRLYYQIRLSSEYGRVIHYLIAGFFFSLAPFILFYALPNMFIGTSLAPVEWTTPWMILLPITLCSLVLSSALIDMTFYIGRLGYYCAMSFVITIIILLGFLGLVQRHLTESPLDIAKLGALTFVLIVLVFYIKEYTDYKFRNYIHPKRERHQELLNRFLQKSKTEYTLRHVELMLHQAILDELPVQDVALFLVSRDGEVHRINHRLAKSMGETITFDHVFGMKKSDQGFTAVLREEADQKVVLAGAWMKPGRGLNLDERMWLETLINYARVVVDNLYKMEGLMAAFNHLEADRKKIPQAMNRWLFTISERERAHLSRDMHDTNIQDQLAIARDIDRVLKKPMDSDTANKLYYIRERILDNADDMRKLIRGWYPAEIFKGKLNQSLNMLFQRVNLTADFHLETEIERAPIVLTKERALCLFRSVQELLRNAINHAQANQVRLSLSYRDGSCLINYQDDGQGMDTDTINPYFSTSGIPGLVSRVEGLGGRILFDSMQKEWRGSGLSVHIELPFKDKGLSI